MSHKAMLIRSTDADFEPRFKAARKLLQDLRLSTVEVTWSRSGKAEFQVVNKGYAFSSPASYGVGLKNGFSHIAFQSHILKSVWKFKPKVIYACDLETLIPSLVAKAFGAVVVYDQFDPASVKISSHPMLSKLLQMLENSLPILAHVRITANLRRIPAIQRKLYVERKNLFPIETHNYRYKYRRKDQKSEKLRLLYGGTVGSDRGLSHAISAISKLPNWEFKLFGFGPELDALKKNASVNIFFGGLIPHEQLMFEAMESTAILALYDPQCVNNRNTASNKLFEACQLGIPLITSKGTELGDIVEKHHLGWAVNYRNGDELYELLLNISGLTKDTNMLIRESLSRYYDEERNIQSEVENKLRTTILGYVKS